MATHQKARDDLRPDLDHILNATPNLIYIYDIVEKRNVYSNHQVATFLGYSEEQIREMGSALFPAILHPEDFEKVGAHHAFFREANDHEVRDLEYRMKHADGSWHWLRSRDSVFLRDEHGKGKQILGFTEDVTGLHKAQRENELVHEQLLHADRLAAIGLLAASVAHEINNPLFVIKGYSELLTETISAPEVSNTLDRIHSAAQRITVIVDGLRAFARPDSDSIDTVDIHQCISEVMSLVESIFKKATVEIELRLQSRRPKTNANTIKIQQVIMNLLMNAKDALEGRTQPARIVMETRDLPGFVEIRVSDTGQGIPRQHLTRVFEPFFTTKPMGKGTGLGLSICHSIVRSFGGTIEVNSDVGIGTTFIVRLPVCRENPAQLTSKLETPTEIGRFSGRVLVVDDEEHVRDILKSFLAGMGLKVTLACSGPAALAAMKQEKFNFIVTDLKMPGMHGETLIEKIRELPEGAGVKIMVITGGIVSDLTGIQAEIIRLNADFVLTKPFNRAEVAQAFRTMTTTS